MSEAYALEPETPEEDAQEPAGFDIMSAVGNPNLAFDLDEATLSRMGAKVVEEYKIDLNSREAEGYDLRLKDALRLASLAREAKNTPWEGAANVKYPLIIQAAIQFNARSYPAIVDGPSVVKGSPKGKPSEEKDARADRIGKHMSWQLLEEEEEWEEDTDQLLLRLAILGTLVRKRYFDPLLGRNCSHVLDPDEFVVNYKAKRDLSVCPRATQVLTFYPHEIIEKKRGGLWLDVELGQAMDAANDDDAPHTFLEQHRLWDLDDDGYPEPYIVTVHKESEKVVRVVARWYEDGLKTNDRGEIIRIEPYRCFTKYGFIPNPDGSFYDIGFGTLLGPMTDTINTTLNQLLDAGSLANMQGGFVGEGVSIKSGNLRFKLGEWKKASVAGGMLKDNIVPLPTKEPSAVLFNLMTFLIEAAKDLTATQDILTGDAGKGTMPVGTVQALVEQGLKTFTAIVKRIHRALKRELRVQYELNSRYLEPEVYFTFQDEPQQVIREDYAPGDMDVVPVSDPNMATDLQRMGQAQFVMSLLPTGVINPRKAVERALLAAHVTDTEDLMTPEGPPPPDPKAIEAQERAKNEANKTTIAAAEAVSNIAYKDAQTEEIKARIAAMGPEFEAMADQLAMMAVERALERAHGGNPQAGQQDVRGMAPEPPDAGIPAVSPGPPADAGPPMDAGPTPDLAGADAGGGFGGPGEPQL